MSKINEVANRVGSLEETVEMLNEAIKKQDKIIESFDESFVDTTNVYKPLIDAKKRVVLVLSSSQLECVVLRNCGDCLFVEYEGAKLLIYKHNIKWIDTMS